MGLVQTPVAIVSAWWQGKVWDPQQRKWRLYNLTHESELLEEWQKQRCKGGSSSAGGGSAINRGLYEILKISPDDSRKEI